MSLFKKRKNVNIRQRTVGDDECEEDEGSVHLPGFTTASNGSNSNITSDKKQTKKVKEKLPKKTTILSFEDDLEADDGIIFQEKKSSLSYKLRKEMKREKKEKHKDVKNKVDGGKDKKSKDLSSISDLDELGIRVVNGREAEVIGMQPGDSDEEGPSYRPRNDRNKINLNPWKEALQGGKIPDANIIHQIRKQRQKARERGDFLPVDDTVRFEDAKSRLIRDDDNDQSEDEGMIKFSVNHEEFDRKQRKEAFDAAQAEADDVDTTQESDWELQQLKKAGAPKMKLEVDASEDMQLETTSNYYENGSNPKIYSSTVAGFVESSIPTSSAGLSRPVNYQAEGIIKRLRESRDSLDEVFRRHRQEADAVIDDSINSRATIDECTHNRRPRTEAFQFYQDMRGYVTDLRECLNEKLCETKKLEEKVGLLYRQRKHKIVHRRRQDIKDQNNEYSPFAVKSVKTDEYQNRRAAEREGRRTRRRRERERKGDAKHHDGMSTDDEETPSEMQSIQKELKSLRAERECIFEDVVEEFSVIERVMKRFAEWKQVHLPSYTDAYVSFNLPKIFSPFIRLELIFWSPFCKDEKDLEIEKMNWFNSLLCYGTDPQTQTISSFREDPDRNFISNVVEKIFIPKLEELVSSSWDPLSHVQSVRLVNLVRHYTSSYATINPSSKQLKILTTSIISRIKESIDNDIFIPMFPKSVYESRTSGVSLFFQRQFWSSWKLFGSILMWHRILSDSVIHDLAIRSLLNLYLLPALNLAAEISSADVLEKARNIINVLPREWCKTGKGTHIFLERLELFLLGLAENLDPSTEGVRIREVSNLLKSLGSSKHNIIVDKYL